MAISAPRNQTKGPDDTSGLFKFFIGYRQLNTLDVKNFSRIGALFYQIRRKYAWFFFLAPAVIILLSIVIFPMLYSLFLLPLSSS